MRRLPASGLAVALIAALLAGCGGGGGASGSTSASRTPPAARANSRQAGPAQLRAERRRAGRAAPFVRAEADNSVPTFGEEAGAAERGAVEGSLKRYLRARAAEDWAAACRGLAKPTREGLEKLERRSVEGCPPILAALSRKADLKDPLVAGLLSLRVDGRSAFALFYGPGHQQYFVPLLHEGGAWRPTQATPIEYPPTTTP